MRGEAIVGNHQRNHSASFTKDLLNQYGKLCNVVSELTITYRKTWLPHMNRNKTKRIPKQTLDCCEEILDAQRSDGKANCI
jgi:hypothetical protein